MSTFSASDVVEVAIRIEENGVKFYKFAEQLAKKKEEKKLFAQLAEAEIAHKEIFEKILAGLEKSNAPESYEGEYGAYLRSYVDNNLIFTKEVMDKQLSKVKNTKSALDFAIQRELDSILYYHEIKNLVPSAQHDVIEKIIEEERKHFLSLTEMKKSLA
jgi:rubrerythrin